MFGISLFSLRSFNAAHTAHYRFFIASFKHWHSYEHIPVKTLTAVYLLIYSKSSFLTPMRQYYQYNISNL